MEQCNHISPMCRLIRRPSNPPHSIRLEANSPIFLPNERQFLLAVTTSKGRTVYPYPYLLEKVGPQTAKFFELLCDHSPGFFGDLYIQPNRVIIIFPEHMGLPVEVPSMERQFVEALKKSHGFTTVELHGSYLEL